MMERRLLILRYAVTIIAIVLIVRLFGLQILHHSSYLIASENNVYLNIKKAALRAEILDRNGAVLATSKPMFKVIFAGTKEEIAHIQKVLNSHGYETYLQQNCVVLKDLNWEKVSKIFTISALPVPEIEIEQVRTYPLGPAAAHYIGYIQNVAEQEYKGTSGIEKVFDNALAGVAGHDVFLINAQRQRLSKKKTIDSHPSTALKLALDSNLQKLAYQKLSKRKQGAIIIINAKTGAILTAVSYPSFNPEHFSDKNAENRSSSLSQYYKDSMHPLLNLFLHGVFPPGSTIKPFMLVALLKKRVPEEYYCAGVYHLGNHAFHCLGDHGRIGATRALFASCNCFFYAFSQYLTQEDLFEIWQEFGLGQPVLTQLNSACPKFPHKKVWKKIDSLFMQIGQVGSLITLAQLVRAYARMATGKKVELKMLDPAIDMKYEDLNIEKNHLDQVRNALYGTVNTPGGTVFGKYKSIEAAGKTGTAQVMKLKAHEYRRSNLIREWKFRDHSLFCAYAPFNDPKVCGCIVIVHGGGGSTNAGALLELLEKALEIYEPKVEQAEAEKPTTPTNAQ